MNRLKLIKSVDNYKINENALLYYKAYVRRVNISNTKNGKCSSKFLKSKIKSKREINKIKQNNIKLAMYGLY